MASGGSGNSGSGLADRYASALYAQAGEQGLLDATVAEMEQLGRLIDGSADMRRLLDSPLINVATAQKAVRAVLQAQGFSVLVMNFASVVVVNRRMRALRPCCQSQQEQASQLRRPASSTIPEPSAAAPSSSSFHR